MADDAGRRTGAHRDTPLTCFKQRGAMRYFTCPAPGNFLSCRLTAPQGQAVFTPARRRGHGI